MDRQRQAGLLRRVAETADKSAFAELYAYFMPRVKGYLMRLGAPGDVAEEVAQESLIMLWRRAASFDPELASVATWVFTIARNKRIDRLRRERRPEFDPADPAFLPEPEPPPDHHVDRQQADDRLRAAIALLPDEQGRLLQMAFHEDLSHRDIATRENLPLGTVKSRIRLALAKLRTALETDT